MPQGVEHEDPAEGQSQTTHGLEDAASDVCAGEAGKVGDGKLLDAHSIEQAVRLELTRFYSDPRDLRLPEFEVAHVARAIVRRLGLGS
jgi:hypothetical protein